jgi:GNAT superfamily N-acetyltransferase
MKDQTVFMAYNLSSKNLKEVQFPNGYIFRSISREEGHLWEEVMDKAFGNFKAGDFEVIMVDNFSYLPERIYILFDEEKKPSGTATAWSQPWIWGEACGFVIFVGVIPTHRGRGLGTQMVKHLNNVIKSRGQENVLLDVDCDNYSAIKSYLNVGFKPLLTDENQVVIWEDIFAQLSMIPVEFSTEIKMKKDSPHPPHPYLLELREQGYDVK